MITAFYDLSVAPPTWDYTKFLLMAAMQRESSHEPMRVYIVPGPNQGFRQDTLPPVVEMRRRMLRSIVLRFGDLLPNVTTILCASREEAGLIRASLAAETKLWPPGYTVESPSADYGEPSLIQLYQHGRRWPRLTAAPPIQAYAAHLQGSERPVLIILRECVYWAERNSHVEIWKEFATLLEGLGQRVVFIRDTSRAGWDLEPFETWHQPALDIRLLFACMEQAELTYGIMNGTMALAWFSHVPYRCFRHTYTCGGLLRDGTSWPWATADQQLIWYPETVERLHETYVEHCTMAKNQPVRVIP